MHTEQDAKTKWCPLARLSTSGGGFNRSMQGEVLSAAKCIGSACMAWRRVWHADGAGYCGLAGEPKRS